MLRIGINGFGRIGKNIYRANLEKKGFEVVAINDLNPDPENMAYQINYDTLYGILDDKFTVKNNCLCNSSQIIRIFNEDKIDHVPWESENIDIVIDSTGVYENVLHAPNALTKHKLKKVLITHSPEPVDFTMILGVNEHEFCVEKTSCYSLKHL